MGRLGGRDCFPLRGLRGDILGKTAWQGRPGGGYNPRRLRFTFFYAERRVA